MAVGFGEEQSEEPRVHSPEILQVLYNVINHIALRKAYIAHNFGLFECSRVKVKEYPSHVFSHFYQARKTSVTSVSSSETTPLQEGVLLGEQILSFKS